MRGRPTIVRLLAKDGNHAVEDAGQIDRFDPDPHGAALDQREVEQGAEYLRRRTHAVSEIGQGAIKGRIAIAARDRLDEKTPDTLWLAQIEACGGQEQILFAMLWTKKRCDLASNA